MTEIVQTIVHLDSQLVVTDCEDEECISYVETHRNLKNQFELTRIEEREERKDQRNDGTLSPQPTEASKVFKKSLKFLATFGTLIGTDLNYEWKWNSRFLAVYILLCLSWSLIFYTQLMHVYNNESKRTLEQFALYGTDCSVIFKTLCFEKYFKRITALFDATYKICQQCRGSRAEMLTERLNANHSFYIVICIATFIVAVLFFYFPIKSFIFDHQLVPFLPVEIIFVDQSTVRGFLFANMIFLIFGVVGISAVTYVALSFVIAIMSYAPRVDILEIDFNDLDELWSNTSTSTCAYRHEALNNICQKFLDLKTYIVEIKQIYEKLLFLCFGSSYFSLIIILYQLRVNHWMNGISFLIGMFLEMIFYCMMGTKITIENERLSHIITQSKWYTYDCRSQKLILVLLNISMNQKDLWIGPLKPLSVFTAAEIIKSIYSYYTIMTKIL